MCAWVPGLEYRRDVFRGPVNIEWAAIFKHKHDRSADTSNSFPLPYNSKNSYTIAPYFEMGPYSASVAYNWRSQYLAGGYVAGAPDTYTGSYKELDSSLGYQFNKNFTLSFNMLNLLNSVYKQWYGSNDVQLANEYVSGREFMLEAHFKF